MKSTISGGMRPRRLCFCTMSEGCGSCVPAMVKDVSIGSVDEMKVDKGSC